jgi:RNA polymerase sigma factor (sigma-70 family)
VKKISIEKNKNNQQENNLYSKLIQSLETLLFIYDLRTKKISWTNKYLTEWLGYTFEEIQKIPLDQLYLVENKEALHQYIGACIEAGSVEFSALCQLINKNGRPIYFMVILKEFERDKNGIPVSILGITNNNEIALDYSIEADELLKIRIKQQTEHLLKSLTKREKDVFILTAKEKSYKETAEILNISNHTVDKHIRGIMKKLNLNSTHSIVAFATQNRMI